MLTRLIFGAILTFALCETALSQSTTTNNARPTDASPTSAAEIFGTIKSVTGNVIVVQLRTGEDVSVDLSPALEAYNAIVPVAGENVKVLGTMTNGAIEASSLLRTKAPETWGPDILP